MISAEVLFCYLSYMCTYEYVSVGMYVLSKTIFALISQYKYTWIAFYPVYKYINGSQ